MNRSRLLVPFLIVLQVILFSSCKTSVQHQNEEPVIESANCGKSQYDSLLAEKYGADAYGMKKYVMAFLQRGPNRYLDSAKSAELQMPLLENIKKMAESGLLVLAGPFFGKGDLRGIYFFNVKCIEKAKELTNTDPAIKAGILVMESKEWYGSAALMAINDLHYRLAKTGITD